MRPTEREIKMKVVVVLLALFALSYAQTRCSEDIIACFHPSSLHVNLIAVSFHLSQEWRATCPRISPNPTTTRRLRSCIIPTTRFTMMQLHRGLEETTTSITTCQERTSFATRKSGTTSWLVHTPGWYTLLVGTHSWLVHTSG